MDITLKFVVAIVLIFAIFEGVSTFTVLLTKSPDKARFGTNQFQLTCTYSVGASEQANSFRWQRKRAGEQTYTTIATFFPQSSTFNGSISEPALNSRVSLTEPTSGNTYSVLTFSEIQCNDEADYRCEGTYTTSAGSSPTEGANLPVQVSTTADFSTATPIPFSPGSGLKEGDTVTFTCDDDIGRDPQGTLHWYYFIDGQTVGTDVTNVANTADSVYNPSTCSYKQISTLVLTMDKRYNQFVVRCTLEQFEQGQTGDGIRMTARIPVNYKPTITSISPNKTEYVRGESVTLTCSGEGNPAPSTQWVLYNGTVVQSSQLYLMDLSLTANHNYTCQLQNNYGGVNYTDSRSVVLTVVETTTSTTTTTTPSTTPSVTTGKGNTGSSTDDADNAGVNVGALVGGLVGGIVVLLIIIGVAIYCCRKKSKPEIEEPPDIKPRTNNQGYYGARPDLVTDDKLKNSRTGLNASFNNSFDSSESKPRNDDGLMYIDLNFDDKPRSRKPIQMTDNGNTPYADIAMPRV